MHRVRRAVSRARTDPQGLGIPCSVCDAPATGWAVGAATRSGVQVIDGIAVCAEHRATLEEVPRSKAG